MIRIGICDDDPMVRQLLASIIGRAPDMEVVAACASGEEALTVEDSLDVWLMDLRMQGMTGREACRVLTARADAPKVLLLTAFGDDLVGETLRAGASGYLFKDGRSEALLAAIRAAAAGFNVNSSEAMSSVLTQASGTHPRGTRLGRPRNVELDELDKTIVEHILLGAGYAEIAHTVHMSESGLKKRVTALMRRMGVRSRPELMARLHELGVDER